MKLSWSSMTHGAGRADPSAMARDFEHGQCRCANCRKKVSLADLPPLTLQPCPHCGCLLFVPADLDGWLVLCPIGSGGMGSVYLACYRAQPTQSATAKILRRSEKVGEEALVRLTDEAAIGASFGAHPNLAQVYGYGRLEDGAFMIMETIDGLTLLDRIAQHAQRGLPEETVLYYALDIVSALEHIYDCGYVYRDLNPSNVIVQEDGVARLVDYGLCLTHDEAWERRDGPIFGTPLYIAPERCLRTGEDFRSDIYSLGMVCFYALKGDPFFSPTEVMKVIEGHLRLLRTQTKTKMAGCHPGLVDVVDLMIKREPEERFQTYDAIRHAMRPVLEDLWRTDPPDAATRARRKAYRASST